MRNAADDRSGYEPVLKLYEELHVLLDADERFAQELARVNPTERRVLLAVGVPPGAAPLTMGELAERLRMPRPQLGIIVGKLASRSLIACSRDAADRRRTLVELTPRGRQWLDPLVNETCRRLATTGPLLLRALREALEHATARVAEAVAPAREDLGLVAWRPQGAQAL